MFFGLNHAHAALSLSAVTGWDVSEEEIQKLCERVTCLVRAFNIREGASRTDDTLAPRSFEPDLRGKGEGKALTRAMLDTKLDEYYSLDQAQRKQYRMQHPEIVNYWNWEEEYLKQFPQVVTYVKSQKSAQKALLGDAYVKRWGLPIDTSLWPAEANMHLWSHYNYGDTIPDGTRSWLNQQWQSAGRPMGSFKNFLLGLGVYYSNQSGYSR